jgi:hypothetical protein
VVAQKERRVEERSRHKKVGVDIGINPSCRKWQTVIENTTADPLGLSRRMCLILKCRLRASDVSRSITYELLGLVIERSSNIVSLIE